MLFAIEKVSSNGNPWTITAIGTEAGDHFSVFVHRPEFGFHTGCRVNRDKEFTSEAEVREWIEKESGDFINRQEEAEAQMPGVWTA